MKEYLGDAVYAEFDGYGALVLTTFEDGWLRATNRIVLEPEVIAAMLDYLERSKSQMVVGDAGCD